jgi:hypothetical protein
MSLSGIGAQDIEGNQSEKKSEKDDIDVGQFFNSPP